MHKSSFVVALLLALPSGCDPNAEPPKDETSKDVATDGNALSASIDGTPLALSTVDISARATTSTTELRVIGRQDPEAKMADDEYSLSIAVDLAATASTAASTYVIDGTTAFAGPPEGTWSGWLSDAEVTHAATAQASPQVLRAWVAFGCFCSRYQAESQQLVGSLVLDESPPGHLKGTLHLDLDGQIPFWAAGFGAHATAALDVAFDVEVEPAAKQVMVQ